MIASIAIRLLRADPEMRFCPRCGTKIKPAKLQRHFSERCRAERMSTADEEFHKTCINVGWAQDGNPQRKPGVPNTLTRL